MAVQSIHILSHICRVLLSTQLQILLFRPSETDQSHMVYNLPADLIREILLHVLHISFRWCSEAYPQRILCFCTLPPFPPTQHIRSSVFEDSGGRRERQVVVLRLEARPLALECTLKPHDEFGP